MHLSRIEIRRDFGRDAVLHADFQQIGAGDALIAVGRNVAFVRCGLPGHPLSFYFPRLAAFAFSRSNCFALSTTKRLCVPLQIWSNSSLPETSKTTFRP